MENLLQSPVTRGRKSLLGRTNIFGTPSNILKSQGPSSQPTTTSSSTITDSSIMYQSPEKGTPTRKRPVEDRKAIDAAPRSDADVKKLTAEIAEQKKTIIELTAQKEKLEHETAQQVFVRQMLIDNLKAEVSELKEQQQQGSQEQRIALEQTAHNLRRELDEHRLKGEKQTAKVIALEAALTHAEERMVALEKESAALRVACSKAEERELNHGAEIEQLQRTNNELTERLTNAENRSAETMVAMNEQIDALRRQFFFSTAISIKLGQFYQGRTLNTSLTDLYERLTKLNLPFGEWGTWISEQLLAESQAPPPAAAGTAAAKRQRTQPKRG